MSDLSVIMSTILTPAVGVAISPFPIAGLILILLSKKPKANSIAYLSGWLFGCSLAFWIALAALDGFGGGAGESKSALARLIYLVLGLLLVIVAVKEFMARPKAGQKAAEPKWFATLEKIKPFMAAGLAFLLSAINPKNLLLLLTAGATVGDLNLSGASNTLAWIIFVLIGSLGIIVPMGIYFIGGKKAKNILNEMKLWLVQNNAVVVSILLLLIGLNILSKSF